MNYRVSFVTCAFSKQQIDDWLDWVNREQVPIDNISIEEVQNAGDAKDHASPAQRVGTKRVGR